MPERVFLSHGRAASIFAPWKTTATATSIPSNACTTGCCSYQHPSMKGDLCMCPVRKEIFITYHV